MTSEIQEMQGQKWCLIMLNSPEPCAPGKQQRSKLPNLMYPWKWPNLSSYDLPVTHG
jgi:hypothetical protein